jgi:threonine dehydratase
MAGGSTGAEVWLKLEAFQPTGSFRSAATNAIRRCARRGPTSVQSRRVGRQSRRRWQSRVPFGIAVRALPATSPASKKDAIRQYGATVIEASSYDDAEAHAHAEAAGEGVTFVSAYSDSDVIAGAGTAALEMIEDRPAIDALVVPLGGGGLLAGSAIVARALNGALIIGVEAAASPVFTEALRAGRPVTVPVTKTHADGLAGNMEPDSQTFTFVRDLVDRVVQVQESSIAEAMRELEARDGVAAEGAGAVGVAALKEGLDLRGRHVGIIVSGRNR